MAKKEKVAKAPKKVKKKKKGKKKQSKVQIFLIGFILLAAAFLPTAFFLFISLLPFFVAYFTDKSKKKTRTITVGALNFAGCVPFLMEMWTTDHSLDKAFAMLFSVIPIIVVYAAAAVGYIIDWAMTYIVSNLLYQRGLARKKAIEKRQADLIERWGQDVMGAYKPKEKDELSFDGDFSEDSI